MAGLTPDVAKALKSTRDLIQSSKRDVSNYGDSIKFVADENSLGVFDLGDVAEENSEAIYDLADYIESLEERIAALEEK